MRTIEKGKIFIRALMVLAVALMLVPITFAADAPPNPEGPGSWTVDIGNAASETQSGITIDGWGPPEPATHGGNWGGFNVTGEDCRAVWSGDTTNGQAGCDNPWATVTYVYNHPVMPTALKLRVLDGQASEDDFTVFVDDIEVYSYEAEGGSETWYIHLKSAGNPPIDLTGKGMPFGTTHTVKIRCDGPKWGLWETWGQLGVDWITLIAAEGVDIGDPTSEAGHITLATDGWGPIEPATHGGNWGLTGCCGRPDNLRVIWSDSAPDDGGREAYVTLDNNYPADGVLGLTIRHLDGIADDSFDVEVKDKDGVWQYVDHYIDKAENVEEAITEEDWMETSFDLSSVTLDAGADVEVRLTAVDTDASPWSGFGTYGQVGFDWIVLTDPPSPEPTAHPPDILADVLDYVDIGEPTSEAGYNLTNWGPVEPLTHPGHWGYPDHNYGGDAPPGDGDGNCRVVSDSSSGTDWASFDMDFGPATDQKYLLLKHLDGHARDAFDVYIDSMTNPPLYSYPGDASGSEYWLVKQIPVSLTGVHTVFLESTEPHWISWDTFGQVGFTWAAVVRKHVIVPATGPTGATVTINGMAEDNFDPNPTLTYSKGPTGLFPVGDTLVTLTATDADGNSSTDSLLVTVVGSPSPPTNPCANPSDFVDIGDSNSEDGHNLQGWGPKEPDSNPSNWGGMTPGNEQCRMIWAPGEDPPPPDHECATVDLDFGSDAGPKRLVLRHLDGLADDSFDVYIDGLKVGHYTDVSPTEIWKTFILSVDPSLTDVHTVRLCATGNAWSSWNTYGQVAFDWIEVCPGGCSPEITYVDIGNPASEAGHNPQGWGPIEPDANGGNWGGFNVTGEDCRVVWADDEDPPYAEHECATVDIDFGCLEGDKTLVLRHLDGLADDSFDVYIDGALLGHYTDVSPTEVWNTVNFVVPSNVVGVHTVKLCATEDDPWEHWDTWGQVGFDWIKVCGQAGMYWKADYTDYAPSGMPDFDQKQGELGGPPWAHCGPVAVANCLWWFDSKFELSPIGPPGPAPSTIPINDNYPLVQSYNLGVWDDHDQQNVIPLISDLAGWMNTGPGGTNVFDMEAGIRDYLIQQGLQRHFYEHTQEMPTFEWVEAEVERSQDVILLLGFYWCDGEVMPDLPYPGNCVPYDGHPGEWFRSGGHYVTVAGVDSLNYEIAFSDPYHDNAGLGGPGRVRDGLMTPHPPYGAHGSGVHNDAGNVSHDVYQVMVPSPSPGGLWGLWDYGDYATAINFLGMNPHPYPPVAELPPYEFSPIFTEVEFAVAISPKPYLWLEPDDDTINVGEEADVDVMITVNEMCGVQFDLHFDPELLEVVDADSGTTGIQISVGSLWAGKDYNVVQNEVNDGTIEFGAMLLGHDYCPSNFYDDNVARITFRGIGGGVSPLNLDDVIVGTTDGLEIEPVFLEDGTLTVLGYGDIQGSVEVQGRPGDHWDGAEITVSGGPGGPYFASPDSDGNWSIPNVLAGDYDVAVEMALYLDGEKTGVSVGAGGLTDVGQVKVLGGDCNDSDGVQPGPPYGIDILDAIIVGGAFDTSPPSNPAADINDDNTVNILDAVLLGENWEQSSPVPW